MIALSPETRPDRWPAAARLIARWLDRRERIDELLDTLRLIDCPERNARAASIWSLAWCDITAGSRRRSIGLIAHPPRFSTRAVLFIAGFELIEAAGTPAAGRMVAKIVHHAVEQTKALASAVRSAPGECGGAKTGAGARPCRRRRKVATAEDSAEYFSHPDWLVKRWLAQFGADATRSCSNGISSRRRFTRAGAAAGETPPDWMKPTAWPGFFEVASGHWREGRAVVEERENLSAGSGHAPVG